MAQVVSGKNRVVSEAVGLGNKKKDKARKQLLAGAIIPPKLAKPNLRYSMSDDVASLKGKRRPAKLIQLLLLLRGQSTQILLLGLIVDFIGGADISA